MFELNPRLAADTLAVASWTLSEVRLMNDAQFPWLILVPRRAGTAEITDLAESERHLLLDEVARASLVLRRLFNPDRINVAALGNVVPQLHVHVIARFAHDPAWPRPVWGAQPNLPYQAGELAALLDRLKAEPELR